MPSTSTSHLATEPVATPEERSAAIPWPLRMLFILSLLILLMASWAEMLRLNTLTPTRPAGIGTNDSLILPGERVGFITIGLPIAEVESRLGAGRIRPTERAVLYLFGNAAITCGVEGGRVTFILTHAPGFQLRTGISVGSDVEMVIRSLGDGYEYDGNAVASGSPPKPARAPAGSPTPVPSPKPGATVTPVSSLQNETYTLHYWEKGIHFNVHGSRIESILVTAPVGS